MERIPRKFPIQDHSSVNGCGALSFYRWRWNKKFPLFFFFLLSNNNNSIDSTVTTLIHTSFVDQKTKNKKNFSMEFNLLHSWAWQPFKTQLSFFSSFSSFDFFFPEHTKELTFICSPSCFHPKLINFCMEGRVFSQVIAEQLLSMDLNERERRTTKKEVKTQRERKKKVSSLVGGLHIIIVIIIIIIITS